MMLPSSFVSIIIVTWNSSAYLKICLASLSLQTYKNFEIILIDNGSADIQALESLLAENKNLNITYKKITKNLGFAFTNNLGVNLAKSKWIALLNADAFPEANWLEEMVKVAEQNQEYVGFSSRQIQYNNPQKLDGSGDAYHIGGLAWRNGYNLFADTNGLEQKEVFSVCAAAAFYSREAFINVGGFDEDFFSYFEDVDLGFRLRLAGKKYLFVPQAVVYHVGNSSSGKRSGFSIYYGYRNMIWAFFKNMPSPLLWLFLPHHVLSILFFIFFYITDGQGKVILKAVFDAIQGLPKVFEKRKSIQRSIKIKPKELLKIMSTGFLEPYLEFISRNKK